MEQQALVLKDAQSLAPTDPIGLIQQALSSGTSPEVIRELVALQQSMERFNWEREERQAKIDFDDALNACQAKIGRIEPNRKRENDIAWADYVGLDKVVRPVYLEAGFSICFSETDSPTEGRRMCATLSRGGVSREYYSKIIPAGNSKMSAADADAGGSSRAMRYLLLKIFNIAVGIDKDEKKPFEDGKQPGVLDERQHITHLENIRNAGNGEELRKLYMAAQKAADATGDTKSTITFADAKNKRYRELQAEGRI
jgi:hypothetical protein